MKKKIKWNQAIIATLTVALGVAGYINFSGNTLNLSDGGSKEKADAEGTESVFGNYEQEEHIVLDDDLLVYEDGDIVSPEEGMELNSDEADIGEAVLTSGQTAINSMSGARLNREQVRSKAKEYYLDIINGDEMDQVAVSDATEAYLKLTQDMEKEAEAETVLCASGYVDAVVSISEESVDVMISALELSDVQRAQIEDIVVRKTGCSVDEIVITCVN